MTPPPRDARWEVITANDAATLARMEVPGGWIYLNEWVVDGRQTQAMVFVPTPRDPFDVFRSKKTPPLHGGDMPL